MMFIENNTSQVAKRIRGRLWQNKPEDAGVTPLISRVAQQPFLRGKIDVATGDINLA